MLTIRHSLLFGGGSGPPPPPQVEGEASVTASATVAGAADVQLGSFGPITATATVSATATVAIGAGDNALAATATVNAAGAIATSAEGQPLTATATITGSLAAVTFAAGDPLLATAEIEADGKFAIPGAAAIIATFDFELLAGVILFAEADIYAFGELENGLFAQVRRKAAGLLTPDFDATLAAFVNMAASGAVTAMAEITKAVGGRERRDAPTLLAQVIATLAGRSGPGGHAVVFPSAVMTGALVQGTVGETDITALGKIEDFAPGAVVYRLASASLFTHGSVEGTARRDTASSGAVTASVAMIGNSALLQRAASDPVASGDAELTGSLIAIGGAGDLSVPVLLVGDALRTIYESRRLHVDVTATATGRRETFAVSGLEGAGVNVVATGGYEQRGAADVLVTAAVAGPTGGYLVQAAGSLVGSATATLDEVLLGSSGVLAATATLEGDAPLTRIAAADLVVTAEVTADGGYVKSAEAAVTATATVELAANIALGASASLSVFGLVLATVAPFQLGEGELVASVTVAESGAIRLLGSRVFIHAEAFVWPRGGFPVERAAVAVAGTAVSAAAA